MHMKWILKSMILYFAEYNEWAKAFMWIGEGENAQILEEIHMYFHEETNPYGVGIY